MIVDVIRLKPMNRRLQFGLAFLLAVITVCSVFFAIYFEPVPPSKLSIWTSSHVPVQTGVNDHEILSYDWNSQTLHISPGMKAKMHDQLVGQNLIAGVPFDFRVDDDIIYSGHFVTSFSSSCKGGLVVNLCPIPPASDQLQLTWGYPIQDPKRIVGDPRYNSRVFNEIKRSKRLQR